jgi:nucleoside-triphosphatase THEP1
MSEVTDTGKRKAVEVIQLASKRWRSMSADEKLRYEAGKLARLIIKIRQCKSTTFVCVHDSFSFPLWHFSFHFLSPTL